VAHLRVVGCGANVIVENIDERGRVRLCDRFEIGRWPESNLVVRGAHIGGMRNSRIHCDASGQWWIEHMKHARSIIVSGVPILDGKHPLTDGDTIDLAIEPGHELRLVFELE
jgi:hypothetical protein